MRQLRCGITSKKVIDICIILTYFFLTLIKEVMAEGILCVPSSVLGLSRGQGRSIRKMTERTWRRGGFVFAPIHVIQAEVPAENIKAWRETLQTFGCY